MNKPFTFLSIIISLFLLTSCTNTASIQFNQVKESIVTNKEDIPESFVPQDLAIVSAGDSLTQGVGDSTGKGGYIPYLKDLLEREKGINQVNFTNFGVRGNRSDQLLKRIKTDEVKNSISNADVVILTIGGNDIMKVVRENISNLQLENFTKQMKIYETNLHEVLKMIREYNSQAVVVLVGVYNPFMKMFSNIQEMNQVVAEWNETGENILSLFDQTYFVSIEDIFLNEQEELLYKDYFHPNDKGYKLIADEIYMKMKDGAISNVLANKVLVEEGRGE